MRVVSVTGLIPDAVYASCCSLDATRALTAENDLVDPDWLLNSAPSTIPEDMAKFNADVNALGASLSKIRGMSFVRLLKFPRSSEESRDLC